MSFFTLLNHMLHGENGTNSHTDFCMFTFHILDLQRKFQKAINHPFLSNVAAPCPW